MKCNIILLLLFTNICSGQVWQAELMIGASGYSGDLTEKLIPLKTVKPAVSINVKYNLDNRIILRGGIAWINVAGDDKFNKQADLKKRNLNFKSTVWEATLCAEYNLMEPELFYAYPYLFGGVGIIHFNPYTYDKDNKKTFLQPLATEGQGTADYPNRQAYSLTQICFPFGAGWKVSINKRYDIIYELGYRVLLTDYLDDVSTTYINRQLLLINKGPKAAELAYRQEMVPDSNLPNSGDTRGNPKVKDGYFFSGVKLLVNIGKSVNR